MNDYSGKFFVIMNIIRILQSTVVTRNAKAVRYSVFYLKTVCGVAPLVVNNS